MGTFGNTTAETGSNAGLDNFKVAGKFTLSEAGAVSKLTARYSNGASACAIKGFICANNAGSPGALLGTTNEVAVAANATADFRDLAFASAINLTAADYWLGIIGNDNATGFDLKFAASGGNMAYKSDTYSDGASDPFGTPLGTDVAKFAIYATYTTGGGATISIPLLNNLLLGD